MKKLIIIFQAVFVFGLILSSCAKPPVEEMDRAYDAVIRAENDADAVLYAGNSLVRARDALDRMQSEAASKRYDAAKEFAAEALAVAERAITEGKTGAARARAEAENSVNGLSGPISETASALNAARLVPDIRLDFNALSLDMNLAERTYDDARRSLAANNFLSAISEAQNVRVILSGVNARITEAAQGTSRKQ